ncbi:AraC family transcriptional regulator [Acetobacter sp. DsW_063]|uniref:AraC family transcriptional regulator n=1 Tax=Acetobacter sp. DsW_063 TaxID=1514894 RepID=UPI000A3C7C6A|nr:helix-turn-helix domain-containing protein [Acetobacter sp. DsW_063]
MPQNGRTIDGRSPPVFEVVTAAPATSFVVHRHDYPAECARWNYHPEYELHLITASQGFYMVGDFVGTFKPGSLVLTGPNVPHNWFSDIKSDEIVYGRDLVIQAHDSWLRNLVKLCPELRVVSKLLDDAAKGIEFLGAEAEALGAQMIVLEDTAPASRVGMFIDLLVGLSRCPRRILCSSMDLRLGRAVEAEKMEMIVRDLLASDLRDVRQSDVAHRAAMTASAFSRLFRSATGDTFTSFLRRLRLSRACDLLMTTSEPISIIGEKAGFTNLSNFNRYFLAEKLVTPRQYRRNAQKAMAPTAVTHGERVSK